jgi:hypothetical protein
VVRDVGIVVAKDAAKNIGHETRARVN